MIDNKILKLLYLFYVNINQKSNFWWKQRSGEDFFKN